MKISIILASLALMPGAHALQGLVATPGGNSTEVTRRPLGDPPGPDVEVGDSDSDFMVATITFPEPEYNFVLAPDGPTYTALRYEGVDSRDGIVGHPAVPTWRSLIAVPHDANVRVVSATPTNAGFASFLLVPVQPLADDGCGEVDDYQDGNPPPDCVYADKPWAFDADAYAQNAHVPGWNAQVEMLGQMRGLRIAQLSVPVGQYHPASNRFVFYESVEVRLEFEGSSGVFLTENAMSPFESGHLIHQAVLNKDAIYANLAPLDPNLLSIGEELLILTHPDFEDAARVLAGWKNEKGIPSNVFVVADGAGPGPDTRQEIKDFIRTRYTTVLVRPSYLLLFGDVEHIPTWYIQRLGKEEGDMVASDFPYARIGNDEDDILPDLALGRISVDTAAQAETVVAKIIQYESSPPESPTIFAHHPFYDRVMMASGFECCRLDAVDGTSNSAFIQTSELVRSRLFTEGKSVDRIYGLYRSKDYLGDTTPRFYYHGSPLPWSLSPDAGFAWDGSREDVISAFNEGRFLALHISHGWSRGWGEPRFSTHDFHHLTNGELLPVVYSLNCSTGYFDAETDGVPGTFESFAEELLRLEGGGAIGVIAGTRMTNTHVNDLLAEGLLDATWPSTLPGFGSPTESKRRLGDILNHGKISLLARLGFSYWNARNHMWLYHLLGDPTLEMWTDGPYSITLPDPHFVATHPGYIEIHYPIDDVSITAWQTLPNGRYLPVGRAQVVDGTAHVDFYLNPTEGVPLQLSASLPNAISHTF